MKYKYLFLFILSSLLVSCGMDMELSEEQFFEERVKYNAEKKLGVTIDPNHTWSSVTKGSITITADAPLNDIARVQILTESPFLNNDEAMFLAEAKVSKGETVTLNYEAPQHLDRLVAACIDSEGHYYIKSFAVEASKLSFSLTANARTRAEGDVALNLNVNAITLSGTNAHPSLNAGRSIYATLADETQDSYMKDFDKAHNFSVWANTNWAKELIWECSSNGDIGDSWSVADGVVVRNVSEGFDNEEKAELEAIFNNFLGRSGTAVHQKQNNLETVRSGSAVKFFDNHLVSDGSSPITIIPVQMASSDIIYCDLYYYYYHPSAIPSGISETDFIKQLPKFKAIDCASVLNALGVSKSSEFFKAKEFLLPYFGDSDLKQSGVCTPYGSGVFRIKNCEIYTKDKKNYYLTYLGDPGNYNKDKMALVYEESNKNLANQLWQIFTISDGRKVLYNIGAKKFLIAADYFVASDKYWATIFSDNLAAVKSSAFYFEDCADGVTRIWYNSEHTRALGSNINKHNLRVASDKTPAVNGKQVDWVLEPYTGYSGDKLDELVLDGDPIVGTTAVNAIIPKGYRIGFMLRKMSSGDTSDVNGRSYITSQKMLKTVNNGCVWSSGELNRTINNYKGHFGDSKDYYGMHDDDPRMGIFTINNCKTYLTFEDGCDCNFSDMIIEIGGYSTSTVEIDETITPANITNIESLSLKSTINRLETRGKSSGIYVSSLASSNPQPQGMIYTMCFEDRPNEADFDMNDVVLQARPLDDTHIKLYVVACGAADEIKLHIDNSYRLNEKEVHSLFGLTPGPNYVNTQSGKPRITEQFEIIEVGSGVTVEEFLREHVYLENVTMNNIVKMQGTGSVPRAIIVPGAFRYPLEQKSIMDAYPEFTKWAEHQDTYTNWYAGGDDGLVYPTPLLTE